MPYCTHPRCISVTCDDGAICLQCLDCGAQLPDYDAAEPVEPWGDEYSEYGDE